MLGALGGALALAGLVVPRDLGPVERAWMGLAHPISKVTTPIFMGVMYFLVLTPIRGRCAGLRRQPAGASAGRQRLLAAAAGGSRRAATETTILRSNHMGLFGELWPFMQERKKWWLLPVIVVMVMVGALLVFAQGSALAPFIYTIF